MARLLSVNVGRPRDIVWKGRTVHTGIWKDPLPGNECMTIAESTRSSHLVASRFRALTVMAVDRECADVLSLTLQSPRRRRGDERGGTTNRKRIQTRAVFAGSRAKTACQPKLGTDSPPSRTGLAEARRSRNRPPSRVALRRGTIRRVVSERGPAMSEPRNAASRMACQPKLGGRIRTAHLRQGYGGHPSPGSRAKVGGGAGIRTRVRKYILAGIYDAYPRLKSRSRREAAARTARSQPQRSLAATVQGNR